MMLRMLFLFPMFAACGLAWITAGMPGAARAQAVAIEDVVQVQLLEGWRREDGRHVSGVQIRLASGWKTYWRTPGEGGIPPIISLDGAEVDVHWPRPEPFYVGDMRSIGYTGDVVLPIEFDMPPGDHGIAGTIELGVCRDICIPIRVDLAAVLPGTGRPDPRIVAALADRPVSAAEAGLGTATCAVRPISDGLSLEMRIDMAGHAGPDEVVFELPDRTIWISDPVARREGGILIASADLVPPTAAPFALDRSQLRITVLSRGRAIEIAGCRGAG